MRAIAPHMPCQVLCCLNDTKPMADDCCFCLQKAHGESVSQPPPTPVPATPQAAVIPPQAAIPSTTSLPPPSMSVVRQLSNELVSSLHYCCCLLHILLPTSSPHPPPHISLILPFTCFSHIVFSSPPLFFYFFPLPSPLLSFISLSIPFISPYLLSHHLPFPSPLPPLSTLPAKCRSLLGRSLTNQTQGIQQVTFNTSTTVYYRNPSWKRKHTQRRWRNTRSNYNK